MSRFFLVLAMLLFWAVTASGEEAALDRVRGRPVTRIEVENPSAVPDWEIRELFLLRPGDGYDPAVVQRGLALLAQKQAIRTVVVRGSEVGNGVALHLVVVPEPLIRSVDFSGNHALGDKALAAAVRTSVDQPVHRPTLDADAAAIRGLYVEEGFFDARVEPTTTPRANPLWTDVTFRVTEGAPTRVTRVEQGDLGAMEVDRALAILGLNEGSRASSPKLRQGAKDLVKVLQREGYVEARAPKPRYEREGSGVALVLSLVAGTKTEIRVEGVGELDTGSLLDIAKEHYGEPIDYAWTDKVGAAMAEALRVDGYRQAFIAGTLETVSGDRRVTFQVNRGPLVRVTRVVFEGNRTESASRLKGYMSLVEGGFLRAPPFTQEALDRDLRVLTDYYVSKGFLDARVSVADLSVAPDGDATLKLAVEEGIRYRLGRLEFRCDSGLTPAEALKVSELKPGDRPNPASLEAARVRLLAEIAKKGFANASVDLTTQKRSEAKTLDVLFLVRAESLVRFGKIVVSGNARTNTRVVMRELTFKEGDPWDPREVLLSRQKLFRLGFFQKVRIEPLDPASREPVRDVRIAVEEQDAGSISFGGGYGTEEGLSAFAEVAHANLWGSGRSVRLRGGVEGQDWSASASVGEPWFLGYRMDLVLSVLRQFQHRPGYDVLTTGFQTSLDKKVTERIRASLLYTLEDNQLDQVAQTADVKGISQYLLSAIGPVLAWDSRDDPFNPTEGFQHTVQAEWALRSLGSEVQYGRYLASSSGFFSWRKLTLGLLARAGFAENFGKTAQLPANKRFYLGGRTTVRGFARDEIGPQDADGSPLGGDTMFNVRAELRFPIWGGIGGDLFWDAGNIWNRQIEDPDYLHLRQGAGGGLRYVTPIGPISLDLGYKLDRKPTEREYEWYFTVGNVF